MPRTTHHWMIAFGAFLIVSGLAGYLSNPEKAKTAILSGGTFGGIAIALGIAIGAGKKWARIAAIVLCVLLAGVFTWRAAVSWKAHLAGTPAKLIPALLITAMGAASFAMLARLRRG